MRILSRSGYPQAMRYTTMLAVLVLTTFTLGGCQSTRSHDRVLAATFDAAAGPAVEAVAKAPRAAATVLLQSLTKEQRALVLRPIDSPLRKDWHFIPRQREGLMFGDITDDQKSLLHKLMQTALSDSGYLKATDIIWLEMLLYEMSNGSAMRSPNNYALVIFGDPADDKAAWGWRLEGHHLSINLTYAAQGIGVTPLFFGTNPAVVPSGPLAGKRVLSDAHDLAVELARSMSDEQRKKMMLQGKPRDVITGPGREAELKTASGVSGNALTPEQSMKLVELTSSHLMSFEMSHYVQLAQRWFGFAKDGPASPIHFAWAGPIDEDKPFYYRIHGPGFVIEYSCQGRNHVHAVIHDLTDPLQQDLLKKHFEQHEH